MAAPALTLALPPLPFHTSACTPLTIIHPPASPSFAFPHLHPGKWLPISIGKERTVFVASAEQPSASPSSHAPATPSFSLKKGQIVRVDKEKYLNSVEYLAVGHPLNYTGLDYIYEDRGEVLDVRFFETGEYALIAWAGISTSPAWLPTYMLIKSEKLSYRRT